MPEYLAPGVYVEEISHRSKSVEGVSTSTRGFAVLVRRGLDKIARRVAVAVVGVLLGVIAAIAVDGARRRRRASSSRTQTETRVGRSLVAATRTGVSGSITYRVPEESSAPASSRPLNPCVLRALPGGWERRP